MELEELVDHLAEELEMERRVSDYLRQLPFLWIDVPDEPGPGSDRTYLERNAIALLSNYGKPPIDPGRRSGPVPIGRVRKFGESGLWNVNYVDEPYDPVLLDRFTEAIEETEPP
jgi:hypothetical protein